MCPPGSAICIRGRIESLLTCHSLLDTNRHSLHILRGQRRNSSVSCSVPVQNDELLDVAERIVDSKLHRDQITDHRLCSHHNVHLLRATLRSQNGNSENNTTFFLVGLHRFLPDPDLLTISIAPTITDFTLHLHSQTSGTIRQFDAVNR
jgi:hypothetical protein